VAVTDAGANVLERYDYDPYGRVTIYNSDWSATVAWQNSEKNEILYCGYRFDPETGFYHVRNRMYHPTLGRWLQRDPVQGADGNELYEYARSRTTTLSDPMGLAAVNGSGLHTFPSGPPDMTVQHKGTMWGYECNEHHIGARRYMEGWARTGRTCRRNIKWSGKSLHINAGIGFSMTGGGQVSVGLSLQPPVPSAGSIDLANVTIHNANTITATYNEYYAKRRASWERWVEIKYLVATEECRCYKHCDQTYYAWEIVPEDSETLLTAWYLAHRSDYLWIEHPDRWVKGTRTRAGRPDEEKYWWLSGSRSWMFGADVGPEIGGKPTLTWDDSVVEDRCPW